MYESYSGVVSIVYATFPAITELDVFVQGCFGANVLPVPVEVHSTGTALLLQEELFLGVERQGVGVGQHISSDSGQLLTTIYYE